MLLAAAIKWSLFDIVLTKQADQRGAETELSSKRAQGYPDRHRNYFLGAHLIRVKQRARAGGGQASEGQGKLQGWPRFTANLGAFPCHSRGHPPLLC